MSAPNIFTIQSLPLEVLGRVCEHLDRASLLKIAKVNRTCHTAAVPCIFRTIRLPNILKLLSDLEELYVILDRIDGYKYVRRIEVDSMPRGDGEWFLYDDEDDPDYVRYDGRPVETSDRPKIAWFALVRFICRLPALKYLEYACPAGVAVCLLVVIHRLHPQCRLDIKTLDPHSLINLGPLLDLGHLENQGPDRHEITMGTLRRLHSLYIYNPAGYEPGCFSKEVTLPNIARLAPNLKKLGTKQLDNPAPFEFHRVWAWRRATRQGFGLNEQNGTIGVGKVPFLELLEDVDQAGFEQWSQSTDFSVLRSLRVRHLTRGAMAWAAANCRFPSLIALGLSSTKYRRADLTQGFFDDLNAFLRSLPPLTSILMRHGYNYDTLSTILAWGPSLRLVFLQNANCPAISSKQMVSALQAPCPNLAYLTLRISRTQGDADEVAVYKSLGRFPKLERLFLLVDCGMASVRRYYNPRDAAHEFVETAPSDPSFDEYDQQRFPGEMEPEREHWPRYGHVKQSMINAAIDETLALQIWSRINSSRPPESPPLQQLTLTVLNACRFGCESYAFGGLDDVVTQICSSWRLKRDPANGEVAVNEIATSRTASRDVYADLDPEIEPVFRRIWPKRSETGGDWRKEWHSFPLASD